MGKTAGGALGIIVVVLIVGAGLLTGAISPQQVLDEVLGGSGGDTRQASGSGPSTVEGAPTPPSEVEARAMLADITVRSAGSMAGYSREEFSHWAADGTEFGWPVTDGSCDVRDDALIRDGRDVEVDEDCSFVSGEWVDPYAGGSLTETEDIDIDHVVPLANAWSSGAASWDAADKESYANDPEVLLSVDDGINQEKGDKGPEAWKPPNRDYWCEYARRWTWMKSDWGLSVTSQERSALEEMLGTCGDS